MSKTIIQTDQAPAAIGTYSQGVRTAKSIYLSGQIPLDPSTMQVVSDEFAAQAHQVFKNLSALAKAAQSDLADAVKLTVYLTDFDDFPELNEVMAEYFSEPYPARAAVQVVALPKQVQIEIDAVLVVA